MPNYQYHRGRQFETRVGGWLAETGAAVMRAAGSKGAGKMDLVAFMPDGRVLIIQCKTNGEIGPGEWNRLVEIAGWAPWVDLETATPWRATVPLVATRGPRAKPGDDWAPRFMRLADFKIPRSRTRPWVMYDAVRGCDFPDDTAQPGAAGGRAVAGAG